MALPATVVAGCWYLRYALSYRDVDELLAERGIEVDHVTVYRWVQTSTPESIDATRPARPASGDRWFVGLSRTAVGGATRRGRDRRLDEQGQMPLLCRALGAQRW